MPKVTLTEAQKEKERLQRNIELIQGKRTNADMGKIIGATGQTFGNRKRNPESFTLAEIRLICRYFKINRADFVTGELTFSGRNTTGDANT
jgi:hypothetical protein